eukprot:6806363-Prymnesium_polylepis.1
MPSGIAGKRARLHPMSHSAPVMTSSRLVNAHCTYVTDDTQALDTLARMTTSTVLDARRGWI